MTSFDHSDLMTTTSGLINYLGLILQANLSWNKHISHISLKVSKTIGILNRLKSIYPRKVLLTLYNTLILPHFNYCILSWGSVLRENHQLHLLQKKAIRIITNSNYIAHTEPLLKELELLKITCMFILSLWKFYYKLMTNQLPVYFAIMKPVLPQVCSGKSRGGGGPGACPPPPPPRNA